MHRFANIPIAGTFLRSLAAGNNLGDWVNAWQTLHSLKKSVRSPRNHSQTSWDCHPRWQPLSINHFDITESCQALLSFYSSALSYYTSSSPYHYLSSRVYTFCLFKQRFNPISLIPALGRNYGGFTLSYREDFGRIETLFAKVWGVGCLHYKVSITMCPSRHLVLISLVQCPRCSNITG